MKRNIRPPKDSALKSAVLLMLLALSSIGLKAQTLVITFTNTTTASFPISEIQSVKFGESSMIINELNGTTTSWNIEDIAHYSFDETVGLNSEENRETINLSIFPNPATKLVNIQFSSTQPTRISVEIMDASGRLIQSIYQGLHQGKQTYQWNSNVPNGTYFCRVSSDQKTITKPVVIQ